MRVIRSATIRAVDNGFVINLSAYDKDGEADGLEQELICQSIPKLLKLLKGYFSAIITSGEEEEELATFDETEEQPLPDIAEP